jgi:hypothetical protein
MGEEVMTTVIRAQLSEKNKYYIDKHRYYELKHFCLQYNEWKKAYASCNESIIFASQFERLPSSNIHSDVTAKYALKKLQYGNRIKMIERIAMEADDSLYPFILKAVTEGLSYTHLKARLDIPCGRDMYYDRYRKFFWLLSEERD